MTFRDRLIATLERLRPVLDEPGVLIVGSEVPNLLQPQAASTLVVSQDVDVAIPVGRVAAVKARLRHVRDLVPSEEEPSVYVPASPDLIEANFLGLDDRLRDAGETYVFDDPELPLMVFGPLGLIRPGAVVTIGDLQVPLPAVAGLMAEKLLTDRTGEKGARDLLVVAGLLAVASPADTEAFVLLTRALPPDSRHAIRSALTVLSLMTAQPGMPDPAALRGQVLALLVRLEEDDA